MSIHEFSHFKIVAATFCHPEIKPFSPQKTYSLFKEEYLQNLSIIEGRMKEELSKVHLMNISNSILIQEIEERINNIDNRIINVIGLSTSIDLYRDFLDLREKLAKESLTDPIDEIAEFEKFVISLESFVERIEKEAPIQSKGDILISEDEMNNSHKEMNELEYQNEIKRANLMYRSKSLSSSKSMLSSSESAFGNHLKKRAPIEIHPIKFDFDSFFLQFPKVVNPLFEASAKIQKLMKETAEMENIFIDQHLVDFLIYKGKINKVYSLRSELRGITRDREYSEKLQEENIKNESKLEFFRKEGFQKKRVQKLIDSYKDDLDCLKKREYLCTEKTEALKKRRQIYDKRNEEYQSEFSEYSKQIEKQNQFLDGIKEIETKGSEIQSLINQKLKEIQRLTTPENSLDYIEVDSNTIPFYNKLEQVNKVVSLLAPPEI